MVFSILPQRRQFFTGLGLFLQHLLSCSKAALFRREDRKKFVRSGIYIIVDHDRVIKISLGVFFPGAGKTAFVRGMARGLGVTERVVSPTFTIVNEYPGERELFHFDMYRLGGADELFDIGWEDYLVRGGVCAVEWSENVPEAFDGSEIRVSIDKIGDDERKITIEGVTLC